MADNRMKYTISSGQFPFVEIELEAGGISLCSARFYGLPHTWCVTQH